MKEYLSSSSEVLAALGSTENGLAEEEAELCLSRNGKNKLAEGKKESLISRFLKQFAEPMTLILIVAAIISGVLAIYNKEFPSDDAAIA